MSPSESPAPRDGRTPRTRPSEHVLRDRALARFLRTHHGAISIEELLRLGFTRDAVRQLTLTERLLREHRGSYRAGWAPRRLETTLRCALVAVGDDAALGLASAAHHRGFIDFAPRIPQIVVPRAGLRRADPRLDIRERSDLTDDDSTVFNGLRCTIPFRTMLHLAADSRTGADYKLLRRAVRQSAVRHRRLPDQLAAYMEEHRPFRGAALLASVVDEHLAETGITRSDLEEAFLDLCREAGIPLPATNVIVEGHEVDAAWLRERVFVKLDTYTFHGDVKAFEADRARDADLTVAGFRGMRITKRRIDREADVIVRQLKVLLAR